MECRDLGSGLKVRRLIFISFMADSHAPVPRSLTKYRPLALSKDRATPTRPFRSPRFVKCVA